MTKFAQHARAHALTALFGTIAVAGLVAPAHASGKTGAEERARQICQMVIGVRPGEYHFSDCVSSLSDSLESASVARAVAKARNACFAKGLEVGSAALSSCLLQAENAKPAVSADQPGSTSLVLGLTGDPQTSEPYTAASFDTVLRRERQACALTGFDPVSSGFADCVSNLQSTLQAINFTSG
jgi:hypothetical protein